MSLPTRLLIRIALTIALVWALVTYLPQYIGIGGGWIGIVAVAALITLLNLTIRPILSLLSIPLKLVTTLLGIVLVNGVFLWITLLIVSRFDPTIASLTVQQGIVGYIILAAIIGTANWLMKLLLRC
jgi:putative membrane protein